MSKPLLTVTLNPALDLTGHIDQIQVGSVNVVKSGSLHPAGKGINVARVLRDLGADVAVSGILGAGNQQAFRDLFAQCGIKDHFMAVPGDTRINVKMVEENGEVTDLNFPGVAVADDELKEYEARLLRQADQYEYIVMAGSLPRGITAEASRDLIAKLQQKGAKVLFDSSNMRWLKVWKLNRSSLSQMKLNWLNGRVVLWILKQICVLKQKNCVLLASPTW
jgi:Fructose-1-phosphate kinase and related fructose-6-phosphate kinase (PfkB)